MNYVVVSSSGISKGFSNRKSALLYAQKFLQAHGDMVKIVCKEEKTEAKI